MKNKFLTRFLAILSSALFFGLYILLALTMSAELPKEEQTDFPNEAMLSKYLKADQAEQIAAGSLYFLPCESDEAERTSTALTFKGKNGENASGYDSDDLLWLSRIIYAEAGTEPLEGKLAVGSVVMNRLASANYPDTIYGVIFDRKFGVQFTPAATGSVYKSPDEESILAAKMCLGGYSVSSDILFFLNEAIATGTWMQDNRDFVMTIGNHDFYS